MKEFIRCSNYNTGNKCLSCGGTGDKYDTTEQDWAEPRDDCMCCNGYGEH
jgi:hypothetical protein